MKESIESRLKDGWFDNIHLESDDFPEPSNKIPISYSPKACP
jgi:hypothetical protein